MENNINNLIKEKEVLKSLIRILELSIAENINDEERKKIVEKVIVMLEGITVKKRFEISLLENSEN